MIFQIHLKAFTLVELIVVITILGILSTIGFVSYSGYLTGTRDTNRIAQITKLANALQAYSATKKLPLPDSYISIEAAGRIIGYQGYAGVDVLELLEFSNGGKDPKDKTYYSYYVSKNRKSMQLLALMEEGTSIAFNPITGAYAVSYANRFPSVYGKKLGILVSSTAGSENIPVQDTSLSLTKLDIVTTNSEYTAYVTDTDTVSGTGGVLKSTIPNGSCKRIKQMGRGTGNGAYTINPSGAGDITVYCDMETTGGGWTLVARSSTTASAGNFGWLNSKGSISDNSDAYSMGIGSKNLIFTEIMIGSYTKKKNIDTALKFNVSDSVLKNETASAVATSGCKDVLGNTSSGCDGYVNWGYITNTANYFARNNTSSSSTEGLTKDAINGGTKGSLATKNGMIFVK